MVRSFIINVYGLNYVYGFWKNSISCTHFRSYIQKLISKNNIWPLKKSILELGFKEEGYKKIRDFLNSHKL